MALIIISRYDFTISSLDLCVAVCEIVVSFPKICLIVEVFRFGIAADFGMGGKRMTQKAVARMGATTNTWQVMGIVGVVIGMLVASVRMVGVGNRMVGMGMVMVGMGVLVGMVQPSGNSEGVAAGCVLYPHLAICVLLNYSNPHPVPHHHIHTHVNPHLHPHHHPLANANRHGCLIYHYLWEIGDEKMGEMILYI